MGPVCDVVVGTDGPTGRPSSSPLVSLRTKGVVRWCHSKRKVGVPLCVTEKVPVSIVLVKVINLFQGPSQ